MSGSTTLPGAPTMTVGVRAKMVESLYNDVYAKSLPREEYDKKTASLSDVQLAEASYKTFYADKLSRADFNEKVGLKSTGSAADAITRGAALGFSDELTAGAMTGVRTLGTLLTGTLPTWGKVSGAYNQELSAERDKRTVYNQNNPYVGAGLEFAGGVLSAAPGALATAIPTATQTAINAAKIGAASGFGDAEGGAVNRVEGAGVGAGLGAAIGVGAPYAVQGVGMVLGKLGKALGVGDSEKIASNLLLKAFKDDGLEPAQITAKLNEWRTAGSKPEALFDIGGDNVKRLARTAAGRTGPGAERAVTFLEGRQADQAGRIATDVEAKLGTSATDFHPTLQALDTTRRVTAAPQYDRAFNKVVPTADDAARVDRFITSRNGQDALQRGLRIIEEEQVKTGIPFNPKAYGVVRNEAGQYTLEPDTVPTLRLMDAVKRGYDGIIEGFRNPVTGRVHLDEYGRAVEGNRAAYVKELRDISPRYAAALDAWSGPSVAMDAANRGRNIFNMKDAEVATMAVAARGKSGEADAFRLGVAQAVRDQIARAQDGTDAVKRIFGSPQKRELLRAAFPDSKAFSEFEALMAREASMYKNAQFVNSRTGSQTQMRGSDAEEAGDAALGIAGTLATGMLPNHSMMGAGVQAARNFGARSRGITSGVADDLAGRLFTSNPQAMTRNIGLLNQTEIDNALRTIQGRRVGGLLLPGLSAGVNVAR